ncbi:MAG: 8-amino-7-oxononanoate synthase [Pseudomonadota bacterium]
MIKELSKNWDLGAEIRTLLDRGLYRSMPEVSGLPGRIVYLEGKAVLNFSSNNYLGMAGHPKVMEAFSNGVLRYGVGSTASRLIAGNCQSHRDLEEFIAVWKGTEAALVFGSGYQANIGIITSLASGGDLVISDELNHASIIDGCRLSRAKISVYPHLNLDAVEDALKDPAPRRKIVVTESVFSMDGDHAPLTGLFDLCQHHGAAMVVDEAHATGVYGLGGEGLCANLGIAPDVQMGTLGKAVGVSGAYVAGSRSLIEVIVNRARSFIFTTAPPPAISVATLKALEILTSEEGQQRRTRLQRNVESMGKLMNEIFPQSNFASHINPIPIGPSDLTMIASKACFDEGLFVQGIRFPSVKEEEGRLRLTIMCDHTVDDLINASHVIKSVIARCDIK